MMPASRAGDKISFGFRCPEELLRKLDSYASMRGCSHRDEAIIFLCKQFSLSPKYYSTYEVLVLRKPANASIFVTVDAETNSFLRSEAEKMQLSIAAILRNIIYSELVRAEEGRVCERENPRDDK